LVSAGFSVVGAGFFEGAFLVSAGFSVVGAGSTSGSGSCLGVPFAGGFPAGF